MCGGVRVSTATRERGKGTGARVAAVGFTYSYVRAKVGFLSPTQLLCSVVPCLIYDIKRLITWLISHIYDAEGLACINQRIEFFKSTELFKDAPQFNGHTKVYIIS